MRLKPKRIIDGVIFYQCNICKEWFTQEGFYKDKRSPIGITSSCKECHNKTSLATRDKDKAKERDRKSWLARNKSYKSRFVVNDLKNEKWMAIPNTGDTYFISNFGRIKSHKWGKEILLKQALSEKGYPQVSIHFIDGRKTVKVHRLVANAFVDNPNKLPEVNHKDECKTNNVYTNLEWCDRQYNMSYGTWKERRKSYK